MGVGTPLDILGAVERGVDMFDCVLPTRLGRHGGAYIGYGETINVKAGRYAKDFSPIEEGCQCYACRNFSRAYIRHLLNVGEILGMRLAVLHNLYFYNDLMQKIRDALDGGYFESFYQKYHNLLAERNPD